MGTAKQKQEDRVQNYEEKSEKILQKMMQIIIRAQRKVDDEAYRKAIEKFK